MYILYIIYVYINLIFKIYLWVGELIRLITGSTRMSRVLNGSSSFLTTFVIFFQPNPTRTMISRVDSRVITHFDGSTLTHNFYSVEVVPLLTFSNLLNAIESHDPKARLVQLS